MPRFGRFDPRMPEPRPILGWYDTDAVRYPEGQPPEAERITVSDGVWEQHMNGATFAVQRGRVVPVAGNSPIFHRPGKRRSGSMIAKADLLRGLIAAGKLRAFRAVLALDGADDTTQLSDDRLALRERWLANDNFDPTETPLREALAAAGTDLTRILGDATA